MTRPAAAERRMNNGKGTPSLTLLTDAHPVIWFDLPVEQAVLLYRRVAVHGPGELIRLQYCYDRVHLRITSISRFIYPIMVSIGFRPEDWYRRSPVYFNMFPNFTKSILLRAFSNCIAYLKVPMEFSATQE